MGNHAEINRILEFKEDKKNRHEFRVETKYCRVIEMVLDDFLYVLFMFLMKRTVEVFVYQIYSGISLQSIW